MYIPTSSLVLLLPFLTTATRVHVNKACILLGGLTTCAGKTRNVIGDKAIIYAKYNEQDLSSHTALPGCMLEAHWPENEGHVYFGADDCLYNYRGLSVDGQCCKAGTGGSVVTQNPYYTPR